MYVIKYILYSSGQHITIALAKDPLLSMTGMGKVAWFVDVSSIDILGIVSSVGVGTANIPK